MTDVNDHLVLVSGESASGKSASLMGLLNQEGVIYAGCESGKKLPFKSGFKEVVVTDPISHIQGIFAQAETRPDIHTIVVDTLTYLMDMYESLYVLTSSNGMVAWGQYAQYFKKIMQDYVAKSSKNVIFLAHTRAEFNEALGIFERKVPVKGALANQGIESYFSTVISTKKMTLPDLEKYKNPLLVITEDDELLGYKHVFQTRLTKQTVGERIRAPIGMWSINETYIDNNMQLVLDRLRDYYRD
jgi:hypothetical protein